MIGNGEIVYPGSSFTHKPSKAVSIAMWVKSQKRGHVRWFHQVNSNSVLVPKNTWSHLAGTFNTKTGVARIYINGKLVHEQVGKSNSGLPQDFTTSGIGRKFGDKYVAYVDDVYMFNRVVSAAAVRALYDKCQFNRMILHYGFQKVNMSLPSSQLEDQSGLGNNATLKGKYA